MDGTNSDYGPLSVAGEDKYLFLLPLTFDTIYGVEMCSYKSYLDPVTN